jgi:hypothetical protein
VCVDKGASGVRCEVNRKQRLDRSDVSVGVVFGAQECLLVKEGNIRHDEDGLAERKIYLECYAPGRLGGEIREGIRYREEG